MTSVNDLGVDIRLNIAVGNNGPIPADNVQLVLYFPSMAGDGSGFYLYPASLTTLVRCSPMCVCERERESKVLYKLFIAGN